MRGPHENCGCPGLRGIDINSVNHVLCSFYTVSVSRVETIKDSTDMQISRRLRGNGGGL